MIKFITIAICIYSMYRLIKPPKKVEANNEPVKVIDIDFEEIED